MSRRLLWQALGRARPSPPQPRGPLDDAMMQRALSLARAAAAQGEVPVGAVVFHSATGAIIGEGANRREADADPAGHAELLAIRDACRRINDWRLSDYSLAVTLEPCIMCAGLIVNARVGRLVLGAMDPKAGAAGSLYTLTTDPRLNHRVRPVRGVRSDESAALLRTFFADLRTARRSAKPSTGGQSRARTPRG